MQCLVYHWAVKVEEETDGIWYEIDGSEVGGSKVENKACKIVKTLGAVAKSGAGGFGGEVVGKTRKTDAEIDSFIDNWVSNNPTYTVFAVNCQKFAIEFIRYV